MSVKKIFTEKKPEFAAVSSAIFVELRDSLLIKSLENVRIINLYEVEGISCEDFDKAIPVIFSEPAADLVYDEFPALEADESMFAVEFLPGQYDQRADCAAQEISMLLVCEKPLVKCAKIYVLKGAVTDIEFAKIKKYLINPAEARECRIEEKKTLKIEYEIPTEVEILNGFIDYSCEELNRFLGDYKIAMDIDDIAFCRDYFKNENRNPTITEIRMLDTYWSDHCRHTTFLTHIDDVEIETDYISETYKKYLADKSKLGRGEKPVSLMDIATAGMRKLKMDGLLQDLDESEEINACSVKIDVDGEDWLLMFKNETHNHPTEIEPFGGGATCLGGAIRDVVSGRAYAHQAMRITGCSDPRLPVADTIPGKLPPRKITNTAAAGYSSYGNQVGLAGGLVQEIYHDGYMAKRMELGALVGAVKAENVVRVKPEAGDVVILFGGKTGRDGCGGATGSSKSHSSESHEKCGAEVQKGDALEGRKHLRFFRNPEAAKLIKRCNDFGAGGISVAIGELADGLFIDLDKVPAKYPGLDGTELAISESQERMAVVVDKNDAEKFIALAGEQNLEAVVVAEVRAEPRLKMLWNGKVIVGLSREFLNSGGAVKRTKVKVTKPEIKLQGMQNSAESWKKLVTDLNICSQRALASRFDSTAGAGAVLMPFGGGMQQTPAQAMAAKIPVRNRETTTASIMSWGFNPVISQASPYHGAAFAIVESIAKIVAAGGKSKGVRLSFQEYFERLRDCPERWGKPFAALLGAYETQLALEVPSIGGKDSMSGSFEDIDVPPTLVSFAVTTADINSIISPEFKKAGSKIMYIAPDYDENNLPDYASVKRIFKVVENEIARKNALSVWTLTTGGIAAGVFKMSLGNKIGANLNNINSLKLFTPCYGAFIIEADETFDGAQQIGETIPEYAIKCKGVQIDLNEYEKLWESALEPIFPFKTPPEPAPQKITYSGMNTAVCGAVNKTAKPRVLIPVFPGTNGEYDMQAAFEKAGAETELFIVRNLSARAIEESISGFASLVKSSNIIAIPGGFAAKFIVAFMSNERIKEEIKSLLESRDGLMLGIGNGFQALLKLGLISPHNLTLTTNKIARHQSQMVNTRVGSVKSPWLSLCNTGELYAAPVSCGEGRFIAGEAVVQELITKGQIFSQYVDFNGEPSMETRFNPSGSMYAIEGLISTDGRILGKMAHTERVCANLAKNIPGNKNMPLFAAGVRYFS
ncbi:MAG: phosphoribosylformylglycinamidine synthase [Oscillospiraceae bacterium]|jgi:phosphoribosylformylglycinamidine synthase|nr:phosphoribosylformylglycinamidine synthase [Oscillospiraceae bacterium]